MTTTMRQEINEIPQAVSRLLSDSRASLEQAGAALRKRDPAVLVTIARGSSDHAAHFLKYAVELELGIVVASLGPSLASIYQAPLKLERAAALAISQSGASPDLVALAKSAVAGGATTISLLNTISSPLAAASDIAIDIQAGPEIAVAATKSFVNSIVAGLSLISAWSDNARLAVAVNALPTHLEKALALDWSGLVEVLKDADSLYMLGRGPTLAIACEAALKCKETSELHAEAYSSAEVLHGPVSLVSANFPIIGFAARDKAEASIAATANGLAAKNASVFLTSSLAKEANHLPFIETGHPLTDALALIVPYYGMVESLSRARGLDPDKPAALKKVTETR
ncbi:SIS domain-containing protein [Agrobacterium vitis]|uniref:SIS domain-containing protein n=1 Tax=Agrobacterium vitis TaxID=373 RepID=A0A368P0M7_AGRVI|nr:SIS domain-containing protein [Agrobacterium vitis]KAA3511257.1 SIS domain-containing protein [Agrobacterium vitis]KAA3527921.1 SIS domain-containing protein [Agrobacterium vitis]MCF1478464.1 SIS domain-containing protein [Agrobacterium vitis]MUZ96625.1 SIS domain-containing protein [Agrobacterium vitis]MVA28522.1 SIS domain-containing protein [Agrobacterium vitis]